MTTNWRFDEDLNRISVGNGIVVEACGGEKSDCRQVLKLAATAPELLEALRGLYGSLAWHIDNHGGFGMDDLRMNQALAAITKATQD
jgi:hypothetical protein